VARRSAVRPYAPLDSGGLRAAQRALARASTEARCPGLHALRFLPRGLVLVRRPRRPWPLIRRRARHEHVATIRVTFFVEAAKHGELGHVGVADERLDPADTDYLWDHCRRCRCPMAPTH
jgi:hypothetical protein